MPYTLMLDLDGWVIGVITACNYRSGYKVRSCRKKEQAATDKARYPSWMHTVHISESTQLYQYIFIGAS